MAFRLLNDAEWDAIASSIGDLPSPRRIDARTLISGIVYVLSSGCAWRNCPAEYGPYLTLLHYFQRWSDMGVMPHILAIVARGTPELAAIELATRNGRSAASHVDRV